MNKVRYILAHSGPAGLPNAAAAVALPLVTEVSLRRSHAKSSIWTLGDDAFHQYSGVRGHMIQLKGVSGRQARVGSSGTSFDDVDDLYATGPELFRSLEKFLENYEDMASAMQGIGHDPPRMTFHMLWEQKSFVVEPSNFAWTRLAMRSRFSYEWTLDLETYGKATARRNTGPLDALSGAFAIADSVASAINTATLATAKARILLDDARQQLNLFREPLRSLYRLGREGRRFARSADALVQWPKAFMMDFWNALDECTFAVFDTWAALPVLDRADARATMIEVMRALSVARRATSKALGLNFVKTRRRPSAFKAAEDPQALSTYQSALSVEGASSSGLSVRHGQIVTVYTVDANETLPDIAEKLTGDRSNWKEIAKLNGMPNWDTGPNGEPLMAGMKLFVPVAVGSETGGSNPEDLYGVDLKLSDDGDLMGLGDEPTDFQLVSGIPNLTQALSTRLRSVQGTNAAFPDYGLPRLVGEPSRPEKAAFVALSASDQVLADPRIEEVDDIAFVDEGDRVLVSFEASPVIGKAFEVTVPFPRAVSRS